MFAWKLQSTEFWASNQTKKSDHFKVPLVFASEYPYRTPVTVDTTAAHYEQYQEVIQRWNDSKATWLSLRPWFEDQSYQQWKYGPWGYDLQKRMSLAHFQSRAWNEPGRCLRYGNALLLKSQDDFDRGTRIPMDLLYHLIGLLMLAALPFAKSYRIPGVAQVDVYQTPNSGLHRNRRKNLLPSFYTATAPADEEVFDIEVHKLGGSEEVINISSSLEYLQEYKRLLGVLRRDKLFWPELWLGMMCSIQSSLETELNDPALGEASASTLAKFRIPEYDPTSAWVEFK
ncbi:hypothetical protein F5Y15DRAFT_430662 [Xylariaceae sp. FL0016]|nr:hypothetical protein F5Y15DRAFT_430662 [Xylariaceae sp. FL0016]